MDSPNQRYMILLLLRRLRRSRHDESPDLHCLQKSLRRQHQSANSGQCEKVSESLTPAPLGVENNTPAAEPNDMGDLTQEIENIFRKEQVEIRFTAH